MPKLYLLMCLCISVCTVASAADQTHDKPLFKDFIGINGHYHFKGEVYKQCARLVRNYHNINWDVNNLGDPITIPVCANKVHWKNNLYGKWKQHGLETSICVQFSSYNHDLPNKGKEWLEHKDWAKQYGAAIARYFGPSGTEQLCTSIEIGNEPGQRMDEEGYLSAFKQMATGIREADPKVKIVTATTHAHKADDYSLDVRKTYASPDVIDLYDVINIHVYAELNRDTLKSDPERTSPWDRSYPEDPSIAYLKIIEDTIAWRNKHATGKEIWVTEFGYDCVTPDAMNKRTGWAKKLNWQGTTDEQQAQYILRSLFVFARREVDRAYIYFFDDKNNPSIHAAAGLTRNGKPKPSFWAVKQCYELLGDYRLDAVIQESDEAYVYSFKHDNDGSYIWVAWSPTGVPTHKKDGYVGKTAVITLNKLPGKVKEIQAMAQTAAGNGTLSFKKSGSRSIELEVTESPCYILFE